MNSQIKPKVIDWRISGVCNDNCLYCYGPSKKICPDDKIINSIVSKILDANVGIVRFSGGEPTLVNNFPEILKTISNSGKSIVLSTNGAKYIDYKNEIDLQIDKLNLPLDGYNAEIQSKCGHSKKSFDKVLHILDGFKNSEPSFPIKVGTVLTKYNASIENLKGIYSLLSQYKINSWKIYQYIPEGENADINHSISTATFNALEEQLSKYTENANFNIRFASQQSRSHAYFIIQPFGDVIIPCETNNTDFEEKIIGNILTDDINDLFSKWSEIADLEHHSQNISLLEQNREISDIEKIVLFHLDENPLATIDELAYSVKKFEYANADAKNIDNDKLKSIVQGLFDKKVIKNTIPVINVQSLGYSVWLFKITSQHEIDNQTIELLKNNDNIAWLVSMKDKNKIKGAIFSKTPLECKNVLKGIEEIFPCSIEIETSTVTEKYILGQRYLTIEERVTDYMFDNSKVTHTNRDISIETEEKSVLSSIDTLFENSLNSVVQKTNLSKDEIDQSLEKLRKKGVFLKFQPVFDPNKLGVKWFTVSMRLKYSSESYNKFIDYLHSLTKVVHINCMIGYWDINFEVHASNLLVVQKIVDRCQEQYGDIIKEYCIDELDTEHKFVFLIKSVLKSL